MKPSEVLRRAKGIFKRKGQGTNPFLSLDAALPYKADTSLSWECSRFLDRADGDFDRAIELAEAEAEDG